MSNTVVCCHCLKAMFCQAGARLVSSLSLRGAYVLPSGCAVGVSPCHCVTADVLPVSGGTTLGRRLTGMAKAFAAVHGGREGGGEIRPAGERNHYA